MIYRFGLDFFLSEHIRKSVDIQIAEKIIKEKTTQVKSQFCSAHGSKMKAEVAILWSRMQKKILHEADLAIINGLYF